MKILAAALSVLIVSILVSSTVHGQSQNAEQPRFQIKIQNGEGLSDITVTNLTGKTLTALGMVVPFSAGLRTIFWDGLSAGNRPLEPGASTSMTGFKSTIVSDRVAVVAGVWADGEIFGEPDVLETIVNIRYFRWGAYARAVSLLGVGLSNKWKLDQYVAAFNNGSNSDPNSDPKSEPNDAILSALRADEPISKKPQLLRQAIQTMSESLEQKSDEMQTMWHSLRVKVDDMKRDQAQQDAILAEVLRVNGANGSEGEPSEAATNNGGANSDAIWDEAEAASLLKQGNVDGAIRDYRDAAKLSPGNAQIHTELGKALTWKRDLDGAIQEFGESVRLEPGVAANYYFRGWCYQGKAQFDRALADYNKTLELDPNYADALMGRADVFYSTQNFQKAIVDYTAYLSAVPKSSLAYMRRAMSYSDLRDYREAIADYEKAVELDPTQLEAYNGLAWLLATTPVDGVRNGDKAVEYGQKALSLADKNRSFFYMDTLAAAYAEAGRFEDAIAMQSKAISLLPKDFDAKESAEIKARLELYKEHKPYRDTP